MTAKEKAQVIRKIRVLWKRHDSLERAILLLERKLSDAELKKIGAAAA